MKITESYNRHLPFLLLIIVFIIFIFRRLPNSFFEQDEWHSFGYYNYLHSLSGEKFWSHVLQSGPLAHFTPLSLFLKMNMYMIFHLNAEYYFFVSIFLHILVAISVYVLIYILLKKKLPAFLGSMFFALNSSHFQAISWLGTFEGTEGATLFGVVSLITYLLYLKLKSRKYLYLSLLSILIALLFKETALTFVVTLGVVILIENKGRLKKIEIFGFMTVFITYLYLRFAYLIFGNPSSAIITNQSTETFTKVIVYNLSTLPIKIFTQILLPNNLLIDFTNQISTPFNIYKNYAKGPWILENAFRYDILTICVGSVILFLICKYRRFFLNQPSFYIGLSLIFSTILPFLFLKKYLIYFDSRYLYPATIGGSIILAILLNNFIKNENIKSLSKLNICLLNKLLLAIFFILILMTHIFFLNKTINEHVYLGQTRKMILKQIKINYPILPQEVVFYIKSDTAYYGLPKNERILPFQSGFGQTLLIWYSSTMQYPGDFFTNDFLWSLNAQGYKKTQNMGFGYYWDFNLLKKDIKQYNIPTKSIIAFSWKDKSDNFVDITKEVRLILKKQNNE